MFTCHVGHSEPCLSSKDIEGQDNLRMIDHESAFWFLTPSGYDAIVPTTIILSHRHHTGSLHSHFSLFS